MTDRALPDLKSRLVIDVSSTAQALTQVRQQIEQLQQSGSSAKGFQGLKEGAAGLQQELAKITPEASRVSEALANFDKKLEQLGQGKATFSEVQTALNRVNSEINKGTSEFENLEKKGTNALSKVHTGVSNLDEGGKKAVRTFARLTEVIVGLASGNVLGKISAGLGALNLPGLGAGAGVFGLLDSLESLSNATAKYSSQVERNTELLGMNESQYQTLYQAAHVFGIENEDLTRTLTHFQRELQTGGFTLKMTGQTLQSLGITTTNTGQALSQLSDWMHKTTDATERNAISLALFGRQGVALTEVLARGTDFLAKYQQELENFGLILDHSQLQAGAAAQTINNEWKLAVEGIKMQVGTQLEGAFTQLYLTLIKLAGGSKEFFKKIGQAIAEVIGFIASLIGGLTGTEVTIEDLNKHLKDSTADLSGVAQGIQGINDSTSQAVGAGQLLTQQLESLRRATQLETQAIDDQIATIREANKVQVEAYNDQIKAVQNRKSTIDDSIKLLRTQMTDTENQIRLSQLLEQQQQDQHQTYLSNLQDELDALKDVNDGRRRGGENLVDYERRLEELALTDSIKKEQDRLKLKKDAENIQIESLRITTDAQIEALNVQKQAETDAKNQEIANIEAQRQAFEDATNAQVAGLEQRKKDLDRHLQAVEFSTHKATQNWVADNAAAGVQIQNDFGNTTDGMLNNLNLHLSTAGKNIGEAIHGFFQDPGGTLKAAAEELGNILGTALVSGVETALKEFLKNAMTSAFSSSAADPSHLHMTADWMLNQLSDPKSTQYLAALHFTRSDIDRLRSVYGNQVADRAAQIAGLLMAGPTGTLGTTGYQTEPMSNQIPRQHGGPVIPGLSYLVNEEMYKGRGSEIFRPSVPGNIIPASEAAAATGTRLEANFYGPVADEYVAKRVVDRMADEARRKGLMRLSGVA